MSIYAIGDLHLSFAPGLEKPMDIYGGVWINHTEKLRQNWLQAVGEGDTVILNGDISWALKTKDAWCDFEWIHQLPGKKVIFKGNHDLWWNSISKLNDLYDSITFVQNTAYEVEDYHLCGSRGWICPGSEEFTEQDEKIYKRELLRLEMAFDDAKKKGAKKMIGVLHFPPTSNSYSSSGFTEAFERVGAEMVVYGHLHGEETYKTGLRGNYHGIEYKLVSLDYLDCKPLLIKE